MIWESEFHFYIFRIFKRQINTDDGVEKDESSLLSQLNWVQRDILTANSTDSYPSISMPMKLSTYGAITCS